MEKKINDDSKSQLNFVNYKIDELVFTDNENFESEKVKIDMQFNKDIDYIEEVGSLDRVIVTLEADIFNDPIENNYPFNLYIKMTGFFELTTNDIKGKDIIINRNTIAIMFPYLRSLVSTITANSQVPPLIIPTININKLLDSEEK
ncbi:protein translocase subunit secB [Halanaerobium saccharolyticum]|uniref:Protein translocase subunit secB n=1 Tax=Halanaerobium saccharolyticum TaxID=43595 RepID=A0A4R7Z1C1_9FIRM|nr:protein-export chaperone SecB [Halanaerobium saccharolyticum]RAK08991.1 protein translocase subunit secB [Halanaerobium saccharolyticum]TDW02615.1 protein translocase subunit secB [Halanaerobium saccharolyticum]TDX60754.1 protein translocase subunit secB [Halanaerobium saccharolyticum]